MANSFDPRNQQDGLESKLVVGLERVTEVFRVLLWQKAKEAGLSPIQIQLLLFIGSHPKSLSSVSNLSREFNLKKPTVSDAIKSLHEKELVAKVFGDDGRAYNLRLTPRGDKKVKELEGFEAPLKNEIGKMSASMQSSLYGQLNQLIFGLNQSGIIQVQRMCFGCSFYEKRTQGHYCQFIKKALIDDELRLDCEDYEIALNS